MFNDDNGVINEKLKLHGMFRKVEDVTSVKNAVFDVRNHLC